MKYLYIIISMVGLGIANYLFKNSSALGPFQSTFFYYLFGAIISGVVLLVASPSRPLVVANLIWPALIALSLVISVIAYNASLESLSISKASTIRNLSFLVSILLAVVIAKEKLELKDIVAIILAICAIGLFSLPSSS